MNLHEFLDVGYGRTGDRDLKKRLKQGADIDGRHGERSETPLHVATRRRRKSAVEILLDHGADIEARTAGGKTAYAHAVRRTFDDITEVLLWRGAKTELNLADQFAVAVVNAQFEEAQRILAEDPGVAKTGNPEEDRLFADVAGRKGTEAVTFLIKAGADLAATGLDDGTPLHQAAWFGQPQNGKLLIEAGAPLDHMDATHESTPLGWAVHGSRYSGGAEERQDEYVGLVRMLLEAGSSLSYPDSPNSDSYYRRMLNDASPQVAAVLRTWQGKG